MGNNKNIADLIEDRVNSKYPVNKNCLAFKHVTDDVIVKYKSTKTKNDFRIWGVIQSALDNPDSGVGVYAGDHESYSTFSDLFDGIIEEYHNYPKDGKHSSDLDADSLSKMQLDEKYVISTRVRVGRNTDGFPLNPAINKSQRAQVEKMVISGLNQFEGDLSGKYHPLGGMSEQTRKQLVEDHFLFKKGDRFLESAGCNRDWPNNRGIYHNNDKTFLVWVNEEDQLRVISMQQGGDVKEVFARLCRALKVLETRIKFAYDDHLGNISSCPTNLGTAMRASVHIKLPLLSKEKNFESLCEELELQARGIHGEHSETSGGVYDLSNRRRLGLSEVDCVVTLYEGVKKLIEMEKRLEKGKSVSDKPQCKCNIM